VLRFTQELLLQVLGVLAGQDRTQPPLTQISPLAQVLEQLPQWVRSVRKFTQAKPHLFGVLAAQDRLHTPMLHTLPSGQTVLQLPQWFRSVRKFTQAEPHSSGVSPPQV